MQLRSADLYLSFVAARDAVAEAAGMLASESGPLSSPRVLATIAAAKISAAESALAIAAGAHQLCGGWGLLDAAGLHHFTRAIKAAEGQLGSPRYHRGADRRVPQGVTRPYLIIYTARGCNDVATGPQRGGVMSALPADDLILISVDDHICEPADMFDNHVPARWRDQAPRVVEEDDGVQQWYYGDVRGRNLGLNAVAGKPREYFNIDASRYDQMRPGCYDVHERVRDMSAGGQLAGLNFPNFTGFSGQVLNQGPDRDLNLDHDPGLQRLARRRVVRRVPRPVHPVRHPAAVRRRSWRRRSCAGWRPRAATP